LISPFVGRILDWFKKQNPDEDYAGEKDPGVKSVQHIFNYYKQHGYRTEVMGASFRNTGEILELSGCDLLTISPALLDELQKSRAPLVRKLDHAFAASRPEPRITLDEKAFRWMHNEDAMATDKLADGIRRFNADARKLEEFLAKNFQL